MTTLQRLAATTGMLTVLAAMPAHAIDWQVSGFVRDETAFSTTGQSNNPWNTNGNFFNGNPQARNGAFVDTAAKRGSIDQQTVNLQQFRGELDVTGRVNENWSLIMRARGVIDPGVYNNYDPSKYGTNSIGDYTREPNFLGYTVEGHGHPNPLEFADSHAMLDFPSLFAEYNAGPLDIRIGNQQIAWGQALFFRVLDVPNGLDWRRHSLLDYVPEEYSDKRVPALGIRLSYQLSDNWLFDSFVQKFQPTVYPNQNTPYNFIASAFTVHDRYGDYYGNMNFGGRVKGQIGDLGVQAIYANRFNPDGVYRWTRSGVNRDLPGSPGSGAVFKDTAFEVDPTGVWSANEWFTYAAMTRLNGLTGLNASINDFPAAGLLGAVPVPNVAFARAELDQFFQLAGGGLLGTTGQGGLRGHIERQYRRENNIGLGASYVVNGEAGSMLDQLIINIETLYTPDRTFTSPDLGKNFITKPEWTTALVMEKYQRFFQSFPATYMVFQYLYKSQSDLYGRYLGGFDASLNKLPQGIDGFHAFAFALQQPLPNLIWRFDVAALYDIQGGLFVQPAVRWKPSGNWTVEAFYNYINARLNGNPYKNIFGGAQNDNEVTFRIGYQF